MTGRFSLFFLLAASLLIAGCATGPEPSVIVPEDQPGPGIAEQEPEPEEPEPVVVEPQDVEPEPEAPADEPEAVGPIEVPADVYSQAFAEVEAVILELNQIIFRGEFENWKTYLTDRYLEFHSDPEVLSRLSNQPILAQNNIRLRSLRDYFEDVVVPSRARARLDDLIFYSDTLVEAVTDFRGQRVILYLLRKIGGEWKIDTLEKLPSDESTGEG